MKITDGTTIRSLQGSSNGDLVYNNLIHKDFQFLQTNYLNAVDRIADATSPISLGSAHQHPQVAVSDESRTLYLKYIYLSVDHL